MTKVAWMFKSYVFYIKKLSVWCFFQRPRSDSKLQTRFHTYWYSPIVLSVLPFSFVTFICYFYKYLLFDNLFIRLWISNLVCKFQNSLCNKLKGGFVCPANEDHIYQPSSTKLTEGPSRAWEPNVNTTESSLCLVVFYS